MISRSFSIFHEQRAGVGGKKRRKGERDFSFFACAGGGRGGEGGEKKRGMAHLLFLLYLLP